MTALVGQTTLAGLTLLGSGPLPIQITKIRIGSVYIPAGDIPAATSIAGAVKDVTITQSDDIADNVIHLVVTDQSDDVYDCRTIALIAGTTLFAVYSQISPIFSKAENSLGLFAADIPFTSLPPGSVTVGAAGFSYPQATEMLKGVAEIATQAEADAEEDDQRFITSKKLGVRLKKVVPIGALLMWPSQTLPNGFLERDGAALSRTTYAALFAIIGTTYGAGDGLTTFNLPDDRGLFERGWDHGRGYDSGRAFGSEQGDAIRNLTGWLTLGDDDSAIKVLSAGGVFDYSFYGTRITAGAQQVTQTNYAGTTFDASRVVPTAGENRVKNRAYFPIIRAY